MSSKLVIIHSTVVLGDQECLKELKLYLSNCSEGTLLMISHSIFAVFFVLDDLLYSLFSAYITENSTPC
jgi:hypothetical protein